MINSNPSISRGRRLTNCSMNQAQAMPLFVTTSKRYTQEEMETLKNLQCKDYILLCLKGNALVFLVPMVQAKPLLSVWSVYKILSHKFFRICIHVFLLVEANRKYFQAACFEAFTFLES